MVIVNPIQLTIVREVPLDAGGAVCAINVENNGESAITESPQMNKNAITDMTLPESRKIGDNKQQVPEIINEKKAIRRAPNFIEIMPLTTQSKAPLAMIKNDHKGIFKCWKGNDADS